MLFAIEVLLGLMGALRWDENGGDDWGAVRELHQGLVVRKGD